MLESGTLSTLLGQSTSDQLEEVYAHHIASFTFKLRFPVQWLP
jgi:hypothetical protein